MDAQHTARFPQYATTSDPAVIAALVANRDTAREFGDAAKVFAAKYSSDDSPVIYGGPRLGRFVLAAIGSHTKPTAGQWTRGYRDTGWRPCKSNPAYAEMAAVARALEPVPGLPEMVDGPFDSDGRHWVLYPRPFVHDGTAFLGFDKTPGEQSMWGEPIGTQWTEILTSAYYLAVEARDAAAPLVNS